MIKLDLPGYSVAKRSAIDGSIQRLPIVFAAVAVGLTPRGDTIITLVAWAEENGTLEVFPNPHIVRTPDA